MKFSTYTEFFENIAREFIPISHSEESRRFAVLDIDDIHSLKKSKINFNHLIMVLENPEGNFGYQFGKGNDTAKAAFLLVKNVKTGDEAHREAVLDECKEAGQEIISMMLYRKELHSQDIPQNPIYKFMDIDTSHYMKVGPLFENAHGFRFEIDIKEEFIITVDLAKWQTV